MGSEMVDVARDAQPQARSWAERHDYVVSAVSRAPVEAVYDLLTDLSSHLEWSGWRLGETAERLLSLEATSRRAEVGTLFESTGHTSIGIFRDRSRVIDAERPLRFAFETDSTLELKDGRQLASTWLHRFVLEGTEDGTLVTRYDRQTRFYHPAPWWVQVLAWPPINLVGYRLMARPTAKAAMRNLARMAEETAT